MKPHLGGYTYQPSLDKESAIYFLVEQQNYEKALEYLNSISNDLDAKLIIAKAKCLIGLNKPQQAIQLLITAEQFDCCLPQILFLKGRALYNLGEFNTAKMSFERCLDIKPTQETKRWIQRCLANLAANNEELSRRVIRYEPQLQQCHQVVSKPRFEWYQSSTHVTVDLFLKNPKDSDIDVIFHDNSFDVTVDSHQTVILHIDLAKPIDPSQSSFTVMSKKVEIKMKMQEQSKWSCLEVHS